MKKVLAILISVALLAVGALGQTTYTPPTVYSGNSTTGLIVTAGTVNNGGHPVAIAAVAVGSLTVSLNKTDCTPPAYSLCNIVYANSSGTVAVTTSIATAAAAGDTIIAYIETGATTITQIVYGWQSGTPYSSGSGTVGASGLVISLCGTTVTCAVTAEPTAKLVYGTVALTSGTPSTASLTTLPFAGTTSYVCTGSPVGTTATIAAAGLAFNNTSASATTITGPNTVTTVIDYTCVGI